MTIFVNIADLRDPNDPAGRSYRQVNAEKQHAIPIGALVEINLEDEDADAGANGVRLFVVHHERDCDMTPLYAMSADPEDTEIERPGFANPTWVRGYPEHSLTVIRGPK